MKIKFNNLDAPKEQIIQTVYKNVDVSFDFNDNKWFIKNYEFLGKHLTYLKAKEALTKYLQTVDEFPDLKLGVYSVEGIVCPICGHLHKHIFGMIESDYTEDVECEKCGSYFTVEVEYNPSYRSSYGK